MSLCCHEHNVPPGVKRSVDFFFFEQGLLFRLDPDQGKRHSIEAFSACLCSQFANMMTTRRD